MSKNIGDRIANAAALAEAELAALDEDDSAPAPVRARKQTTDASQVYSVRIPVDRLAQLRDLADARGVTPSALLRRWVVERLEVELGGLGAESPRSALDDVVDKAVTKSLQRHGLLDTTVASRPGVDPAYLDPSGPVRLGKRRLAVVHAMEPATEAAQ